MWYNPTFTAEQYAAKVTGVLGFFPFVVGLPVFLAVYAEDLRCRALHTAIGCGVARGCIVAAKLLESALLLLGAAALWAKGYYNDRYVADELYYTRVPVDEVNVDSWLVDADGVPQAPGKEYHLTAYNDRGEAREVAFTQSGSAGDYYAPGTWLALQTSPTLVVGVSTTEEAQVPAAAREKILDQGTRLP